MDHGHSLGWLLRGLHLGLEHFYVYRGVLVSLASKCSEDMKHPSSTSKVQVSKTRKRKLRYKGCYCNRTFPWRPEKPSPYPHCLSCETAPLDAALSGLLQDGVPVPVEDLTLKRPALLKHTLGICVNLIVRYEGGLVTLHMWRLERQIGREGKSVR